MANYLDSDGLLYLWQKIKTLFDGKVDKVTGKGLSESDYTSAEKTKLAGIAAGAQVNQNAFSSIAVGSTTIAADAATDTLTITAGSNITLTPNASNDALTIAAKDTTYAAVTTSANGLMIAADKAKLDAFGAASTYALKSDITNMYKYKGSVASVASLPATGNTVGDVYNVEASGMNYAWNGTAWDALGEIFTITSITNAEIDTIAAS